MGRATQQVLTHDIISLLSSSKWHLTASLDQSRPITVRNVGLELAMSSTFSIIVYKLAPTEHHPFKTTIEHPAAMDTKDEAKSVELTLYTPGKCMYTILKPR